MVKEKVRDLEKKEGRRSGDERFGERRIWKIWKEKVREAWQRERLGEKEFEKMERETWGKEERGRLENEQPKGRER